MRAHHETIAPQATRLTAKTFDIVGCPLERFLTQFGSGLRRHSTQARNPQVSAISQLDRGYAKMADFCNGVSDTLAKRIDSDAAQQL